MLSWLSDILVGGVILLLLVGSIFTVKGNIQDATKVTGTIQTSLKWLTVAMPLIESYYRLERL